MAEVEGASTFQLSGEAYDSFMGRFSSPLAPLFADAAGVAAGQRALDVGCGPGALTAVLLDRLGTGSVAACDPSPPFVAACAARYPGVDVRAGRAEALPFDDDSFDVALTQLVLHFVSDAGAAAHELRRVVRPGGRVAACVWEPDDQMQLLAHFWEAATTVDPDAVNETSSLRFGRDGELIALFESAGVRDVEERTLTVSSRYTGFDELWESCHQGAGPIGAYCASLAESTRNDIRDALFDRVGRPAGGFTLSGSARCAVGRVPA